MPSIVNLHIDQVTSRETSHGIGVKKVLLDQVASSSGIQQIAYTTVRPGEEVLPHVHLDMEECFFVTKGEIDFIKGEEICQMHEGSFVFVPAGITHSLKNLSKHACEMLTIAVTINSMQNISKNF